MSSLMNVAILYKKAFNIGIARVSVSEKIGNVYGGAQFFDNLANNNSKTLLQSVLSKGVALSPIMLTLFMNFRIKIKSKCFQFWILFLSMFVLSKLCNGTSKL